MKFSVLIKKIIVLPLGGLLLLFFISCAPGADAQHDTQWLLGTSCSLTWYENDKQDLIEKAFQLVNEYEQIISKNIETSEVSLINKNKGEYVQVSEVLAQLIRKALIYAEKSGGLFDPTIGDVVDLWDIGGENPEVPDRAVLEKLLTQIDYLSLEITNDNRVRLMKGSLDLGGIAKGYIADKVREFLSSEGLETAIINLGGNILLHGSKSDGSTWKIGIQNPEDSRGAYLGILEVPSDFSFVTSGDYERFFEKDGVVFHHILNPETGFPENNNLRSVTVVSAESSDGDALSTTLFLMGIEEGLKFVSNLEGIEAVFVTKNHTVYISEGLKNRFSLTSEDFSIQ